MSSAISGLISSGHQRQQLKGQAVMARKQAELTRWVGKAQKSKSYADATTTEETAKRNAVLTAQQMRQMRKSQEKEAGAAEAAMASSGFDVGSGSGKVARESAIEQFDEYISNMAESSSISAINAQQRAIDLRREGDMSERMANIDALGYEGQARAYLAQAKATKQGMITGAIGAAVGATVGAFTGGVMGAEALGSMGWNIGAGFNPYTASTTSGMGMGNLASMFSGSSMFSSLTGGSASAAGWTPTGSGWMDSGGFVGRSRS